MHARTIISKFKNVSFPEPVKYILTGVLFIPVGTIGIWILSNGLILLGYAFGKLIHFPCENKPDAFCAGLMAALLLYIFICGLYGIGYVYHRRRRY